MAGPKKKLLLPATMRRAGWDVLAARHDIEAVPFEVNIAPDAFHRLLSDAHGVGLSLTPFGEAEARAAPHLQDAMGTEPQAPRTPEQINAMIRSDYEKYGAAIRAGNITAD